MFTTPLPYTEYLDNILTSNDEKLMTIPYTYIARFILFILCDLPQKVLCIISNFRDEESEIK